jgi:hypothetical protein
VRPDDKDDFDVELNPGLVEEGDELGPAAGYTWVNADDPNDLSVRPLTVAEIVSPRLPSLEQYAEAVLPEHFESGDWIDVGPADIKYDVARGPISLRFSGTTLTASLRAFYVVEVSNLVLGARFSTASCGVDEEPRVVDASLSTTFRNVAGQWISSTAVENLSFPNRCTLTIADIDVTDQISTKLRAGLNDLATKFDDLVASMKLGSQ